MRRWWISSIIYHYYYTVIIIVIIIINTNSSNNNNNNSNNNNIIIILLLQVIPVKVNYNYFTLYKASSLNLKIIWSKRVRFFDFLRCCIFIRRIHGSRLSAIVRSDAICFYWNGWMKIDRSFWCTNHVQWHTNHVKEKVKSTITADSWVTAQAD